MSRDNKSAKHISMELTADGARVTNLSLEGSRLVLTIEAELADSHLRSTNGVTDTDTRETAPVGIHTHSGEAAFERRRDDTEVVSHSHPGDTETGALAMGSENLPPAPAAYAPKSLSVSPEQLLAPEDRIASQAQALFPQTEDLPTTPPPLPKQHQCTDGNDTQELDIDQSKLIDDTDTISFDESAPKQSYSVPNTDLLTETWETSPSATITPPTRLRQASEPVTPVSDDTRRQPPRTPTTNLSRVDSERDPTVPPPLSQVAGAAAAESQASPAILGESVKPLTESEVDQPPVEPWKAPELSGVDVTKSPAAMEAEAEKNAEVARQDTLGFVPQTPPQPQVKTVESAGEQLAFSEESSTIGGDRHGEPQPAISFGQDLPTLPPELPKPEAAKAADEPKPAADKAPTPDKPEGAGTTVLIRYTCPKCKTQGMQAVDKVGTVVNCSNCGKAMRLVMKK